mmetsp:Transcript_151647/g.267658  ORF Transcript_151647/g.267658 Transcript_151647/m.267658 type:complete len:241 (-) Transcript_151647:101-823(-)
MQTLWNKERQPRAAQGNDTAEPFTGWKQMAQSSSLVADGNFRKAASWIFQEAFFEGDGGACKVSLLAACMSLSAGGEPPLRKAPSCQSSCEVRWLRSGRSSMSTSEFGAPLRNASSCLICMRVSGPSPGTFTTPGSLRSLPTDSACSGRGDGSGSGSAAAWRAALLRMCLDASGSRLPADLVGVDVSEGHISTSGSWRGLESEFWPSTEASKSCNLERRRLAGAGLDTSSGRGGVSHPML